MDNRDAARRATIIAFRNRMVGDVTLSDGTPITGKSTIEYDGDFPYMDLVNRIEIDPKNHQHTWNVLYSEFSRCWREYERGAM